MLMRIVCLCGRGSALARFGWTRTVAFEWYFVCLFLGLYFFSLSFEGQLEDNFGVSCCFRRCATAFFIFLYARALVLSWTGGEFLCGVCFLSLWRKIIQSWVFMGEWYAWLVGSGATIGRFKIFLFRFRCFYNPFLWGLSTCMNDE